MLTELFFLIPTINLLLSIGVLGLLIVSGFLLYDLSRGQSSILIRHLSPWVWYIIIGVTGGGVALSLLYSEVFGFVPCSLCWLQRIALYPQLLLGLLAWRSNDTTHFPRYGIGLSLFGMLVATYHYIYQLLPAETRATFAPCLTDGTADCAETIMNVFGFVTFPFISAATFIFLIILYLILLRRNR